MELIDTPNPNAKKIETTIEQDEVKKALEGITVLLQFLLDLDS